MTRVTRALLVVGALLTGVSQAFAQETQPAEGRAVVTIIPGGTTFLMEGKNSSAPSFGSYDLGGAVAGNFNKYIGVEGEVYGALGLTQTLTGFATDMRTPHTLNYTGNLIVSFPAGSIVPYVAGGVGGMSVYQTADLGINSTETFLTGNVGGGLKWYSGRWGARVDYRFLTVRAKNEPSNFFGQEMRYGHRIYGGVLLNLAR